MWNWLGNKNKPRNRRVSGSAAKPQIERLETRELLAGNVTVSLNGPHLSIVGDTADNLVEVAVNNNKVEVRGLSDTTINGGTSVFVAAANTDTVTGNILISLGNGNDTAVFSRNVKLNGAVSVVGGAGDDELLSTGAVFNHNVAFFGGVGDDTISLQDSTTQAGLIINGDAGDNLISLTDMTINGPSRLIGGQGEDGISLNNVGGVGGIEIGTGRGDDSVTVRNSTRAGALIIRTRQGQDAVMLDENTFNGAVSINTGRNNDAVDIRDKNTFNSFLGVLAGDSRQNEAGDILSGDQVNVATQNVFNAGRRIRREEGTTIPTAINDRFDEATNGLVARAAKADTDATTLVGMTLTAAASSSKSATSTGDVVITKDSNVTISGTTLPGATVTLDTDNDGQFDDATVTADGTGAYTTTVVVARKDLYTGDSTANDQLTGLQTIKVRSTSAGVGSLDKSVTVDYVTGTVVKFTSALGSYEVELFDTLAPGTVTNFLNYLNSGRYANSIIHRSVNNFVIQGGGFKVNGGVLDEVTTDAPITGEFNAARGNIKGTLSMALSNGPNTGTSQWFVNLKDNSASLDTVPHTVFGRVIGNGQTVVDAVAALSEEDLKDETSSSAMGEVPIRNPFTAFARTLTGTVSTTANSTTVTGVGTKFLTELKGSVVSGETRSRIQINGQTFFVAAVSSDTQLTVTAAPTSGSTNVTAKTDFTDADFVQFTSITEILDTV